MKGVSEREMCKNTIVGDKYIYGLEGFTCIVNERPKMRKHISSIELSLFYLQIDL